MTEDVSPPLPPDPYRKRCAYIYGASVALHIWEATRWPPAIDPQTGEEISTKPSDCYRWPSTAMWVQESYIYQDEDGNDQTGYRNDPSRTNALVLAVINHEDGKAALDDLRADGFTVHVLEGYGDHADDITDKEQLRALYPDFFPSNQVAIHHVA